MTADPLTPLADYIRKRLEAAEQLAVAAQPVADLTSCDCWGYLPGVGRVVNITLTEAQADAIEIALSAFKATA